MMIITSTSSSGTVVVVDASAQYEQIVAHIKCKVQSSIPILIFLHKAKLRAGSSSYSYFILPITVFSYYPRPTDPVPLPGRDCNHTFITPTPCACSSPLSTQNLCS